MFLPVACLILLLARRRFYRALPSCSTKRCISGCPFAGGCGGRVEDPDELALGGAHPPGGEVFAVVEDALHDVLLAVAGADEDAGARWERVELDY